MGTHVARTSNPHAKLPRAQISMRTALTVVPVVPGGESPDSNGKPGEYTCVYVLGYPGAEGYVANVDFDVFARSGGSLLSFPPGINGIAYKLTIEGTTYDLAIESNERREASAVRATLRASSILEAEGLAYDNILPIVSWLAFHYDVGLAVRGWVVTEVATSVQRIRVGFLGEPRELANEVIAISLTQAARMLLATYREASASSNIFLQALSFWKVVEGVYTLRSQEAEERKGGGEGPTVRVRELIPATLDDVPFTDKWACDGFQRYLGKRFTFVRDDLRERLRHGLAHLLPGDANVKSLSADVFNDVAACEEALPVLRYMAQTLISSYLTEHGMAVGAPATD